MNAQTIAEAKSVNPTSLWDFLVQLPGTMEAQIFYGLILAGSLGMFVNYIQKWARQEIAGNLFEYLFVANIRGTVLSFSGTLGAAVAAITAHIFTTSAGDFVGWGTVLWVGITNGFTFDAIANRGERKEWTARERADKTGKEP